MTWIINILDVTTETGETWIVGPFPNKTIANAWAVNHAPEGLWIAEEIISPTQYKEHNPCLITSSSPQPSPPER